MKITEAISRSINEIGHPATYIEIHDHIINNSYYSFGAKSSISIVRVKLRLHSDNVQIQSGIGKAKFFHSEGGTGKEEVFSALANPIESQGQARKRSANKSVVNKSTTSVVRNGTFFENITKWYEKQDLSIHKLAGLECLWMLFGSLLPIFIDSILRKVLLNIEFIDAVKQNLKAGEIFLLTSALIMPFCFVLITYINSDEENKQINKLPYFGWVFFLTLVSLLTGIFTFLYYRIGQLVRAQAESDVVKTMFSFEFGNWAFAIFIMSLFIWYYSSYMNHRSTTAYKNIRKKQQNKLERDFDSNNREVA
jgi:hypothetical protein